MNLQSIQFNKARSEIQALNSSDFKFRIESTDFGFYDFLLGRPKELKFWNDTVKYHSILESLNVLNQNQHQSLNNISLVTSTDLYRNGSIPAHSTPEYTTSIAGKNRFLFTFVRDPLHRFISGYNEIECRIKGRESPLISKLGTRSRLKEFIKYIVHNRGSDYMLTSTTLFAG